MPAKGLPLRHLLLALAVVAVWGTNFTVIRAGLDHLPALLFATLRFVFALFPAILFIRRPQVSWRNMATYGVLTGAGQFGLLFLAMRGQISPGLASLVIQTQVFFTIGLSVWRAGERVAPAQWMALAVGAGGIALIAAHTDAATTPLGLVLVLLAAFSWACGNIVAKQSDSTSMVGYVVWASLFSAPPLFLLSLAFEGWPAILQALRDADAATWGAVAWQSVGNTLFGFAAWAWLLARHPAATVTPMALLVPIFGMAASSLLLGEPLPAWKIIAALLVLGSLAVTILLPHWRRATPAPRA